MRYDLLEPGLALAGAPRSAADLEHAPFGGILNLCDFGSPRYERGLRSDIALVRRPINDIYPIPLPYLALAVLELAELRRQGRFTLVHCHAGMSRSPSIVALYWMARDEMSWDEAMSRVRSLREQACPNRYFETDRRRPQITGMVRELLAGDATIHAAARRNRESLIATFQERDPDVAVPDDGWNLIESGLAIGGATVSPENLWSQDVGDVVVAAFGNDGDPQIADDCESADGARIHHLRFETVGELVQAGEQVTEIRRAGEPGRSLCIRSQGDEHAGSLLACASLMHDRGWDVATAMWFVGSRRAALWSQVQAIWSVDWDAPASSAR